MYEVAVPILPDAMSLMHPRDLQGFGEYIEPGGDSYKGDFVDDKCHGKGTFKFANGATYEGEWSENKFHGNGKYVFANGSSYEVRLTFMRTFRPLGKSMMLCVLIE